MANKRPQTPVDNPFPTRAEDVVNKGLRAGIDAVPVLGSNLVEFLAFVLGDPAQERRDDFMKTTLERVLDLGFNFERLEKEALRSNEQFHLKGNRPIAERIVADLEAMGLLSGASLHVTMSGQG